MACDLKSIRERQAKLIAGRWDITPVGGDPATTPRNARDMVGRVIYDDVNALLDEVDRLRAALGDLP